MRKKTKRVLEEIQEELKAFEGRVVRDLQDPDAAVRRI